MKAPIAVVICGVAFIALSQVSVFEPYAAVLWIAGTLALVAGAVLAYANRRRRRR